MWTIVCLWFSLALTFVLLYVGLGNANVVYRLPMYSLGLKLSLNLVRILYFVVSCILIRLHQSKKVHSTTWQASLFCEYQIISIFSCCNLQNMNMFSRWSFFIFNKSMRDVLMTRKSFSHDGQQFHQYQETHLSPQSHWLQYRPRHITLKIHVLPRDGQRRSFVDISDMVDHHCLHFLFIISTISVIIKTIYTQHQNANTKIKNMYNINLLLIAKTTWSYIHFNQ
jgi:hypothetical protein